MNFKLHRFQIALKLVYIRSILVSTEPQDFWRPSTKNDQNFFLLWLYFYQRWSRGHKTRGQGHKENPRLRSRTDFPWIEPLEAKDRNAQGQGPRTQRASFLKKKGLRTKIAHFPQNFRRFPQTNKYIKKEGFRAENRKFFVKFQTKKKYHDLGPFLTNQKIVLSSAKDRAFLRTWRLQGQRLDLRGQGQGFQYVSSRTPPLIFTLYRKCFMRLEKQKKKKPNNRNAFYFLFNEHTVCFFFASYSKQIT